MKKLFITALLSISPNLHANQIAVGLITNHVYDLKGISPRYEGCLDADCRTIVNPMIAYRIMGALDLTEVDDYGRPLPDQNKFYKSHTVFAGLNSIHEAAIGYFRSAGINTESSKYGIVLGAYAQDEKKFNDRGIEILFGPRIGNIGILPLFGLEHQYRLTERVFTNTLVSPIIINLGIGVEI